MTRRARIVLPDVPHHVTQRGNRRQRTFFCEEDYLEYRKLLKRWAKTAEVRIWCYCLMPNHVHLIAEPLRADALAVALHGAHAAYARRINSRFDWKGHLWQERFYSSPMDDAYALKAVRYVLRNPVRAGLVEDPCDWPHSSVRAHLDLAEDDLVDRAGLTRRVADWATLLQATLSEEDVGKFRRCTRAGYPVGSRAFLRKIERDTGIELLPRRRGRPKGNK